jgi:hypothetical protein
MMTARVGRSGFHIVLSFNSGEASIGLSGAGRDAALVSIPCSFVGLLNVLSGVDYSAVSGENICIIRRHESHVEFLWKRGSVETLLRLTKGEYRGLLDCASEQSLAFVS